MSVSVQGPLRPDTSAKFSRPKQITRPTQIQGVRKQIPPLDGNCCKAILQEHGYREGERSVAIFVSNLPQGVYLCIRKVKRGRLQAQLNVGTQILAPSPGLALLCGGAPFSDTLFCHNSKTTKGTSYCSSHSFTPTQKSQRLSLTTGLFF